MMKARKKGFTLVELMVVLAIMGILAAIVVPTTLHFVNEGKIEAAESDCATILRVLEVNISQRAVPNEDSEDNLYHLNGWEIADMLNIYMGGDPADETYVSVVVADGSYTLTVTSPVQKDGAYISRSKTYIPQSVLVAENAVVVFRNGTWA